MSAVALKDPSRRTGSEAAPVLSEAEFRRIAAILHADSGIHLPEGKNTLVYSRLAKRLRALGLESFRDYCNLVSSDEGKDERRHMLSALTTNHTRFFREPHHFTDLARHLRERWVPQARAGGRVRIWSAGCSSGEEPYTIALTVLSVFPDADRYDFRILATDIDPVILGKARAGLYAADTVRDVPVALREKFTERQPDGRVAMGAALRKLITFNELNLMGAWPMKGRFDAIFCRNVAIYFEEETQERLWTRFTSLLTPDGRLFVGHSERAADPRLKTDGQTVYRLAGAMQ